MRGSGLAPELDDHVPLARARVEMDAFGDEEHGPACLT